MDNKKRNLLKHIPVNAYVYLLAIAVLTALLLLQDMQYAYVGGVIAIFAILYTLYKLFNAKKEAIERMRYERENMNKAKSASFLDMPIPVLAILEKGEILWYNSKFLKDILKEQEAIGEKASDVLEHISWQELKKLYTFDYQVDQRSYKVYKSYYPGDDAVHVLYFYDESAYVDLLNRYEDENILFMALQIDNFEEILSEVSDDQSPFLISEVGQVLKKWASESNALLQKIDTDEYLIVLERQSLDGIEERKFTILDEIRAISYGNKQPLTLSIGIADMKGPLAQREIESKKALELALGRGGDQAVIKKDGNFEFFGGRSKSVKRKSKIKSRTVSVGLANLLNESGDVYIMGHHFPDMDSYASSIGMYRFAKTLGKDAYIVIDTVTDAIVDLYNLFKDDSFYKHVTTEDVRRWHNKNDILIVVDTHRPNFTESPEVIDFFQRRVVIDHHRRGAEIVENLALLYLEPYASSASEMISEMLSYLPDCELTPNEATVLLSGIVLDTKNFVFNTGFRTFEASAYLRKNGADTQLVRELFKEDLTDSIIKSNIVSSAVEIKDGIVISSSPESSDNIKKIISQGADELIDIKGIKTAFVLGKNHSGMIFVSARSNGSTNVQVILESVGGGGHLETAGAQFTDKSMDEVRKILMKAINTYLGGQE